MSEIEALRPDVGELVEHDPLLAFTERWLANRRFSPHTREAYRRDVRQWLAWCEENGLDPLRVDWPDVNTWRGELENGERPLAPATVHRKMSAVSSWYGFLVKLKALPANPAGPADRPMVDRDYSPTVSFAHEDARAMLRQVGANGDPHLGPAAPLLATWLVELGTRASETCAVQVEDLSYDGGHRIVHMRKMKGGRSRARTIPPSMNPLLDRYLAWRSASDGVPLEELRGPLFVTGYGFELTRHDIYRFVRRLARAAGLANAHQISPHSFRHAWNRMSRRRGAPLEDRQRAMGHKDPRTTQRYDQNDFALERDPSLLVAAAVAEPDDTTAPPH